MRIILKILLPTVLLAVVVAAVVTQPNNLWSKSSSSDGKFLYQPSIYLQQGADPTSTLFPVLYEVANKAGRYFIVKVYFKN